MLSLALMLCASLPLAAADATATDDESLLGKIFDAFRPMVSRVLSNDAAKAHLWLQAAGRNLTYGASMRRPPLEAEDMPQHTPQLMRTFSRLDLGVARYVLGHPYNNVARTETQAAFRAALTRIGSVGVDLTQQAFYWRVAASPAVRHICEVGFNAGHSAIVRQLTEHRAARLAHTTAQFRDHL